MTKTTKIGLLVTVLLAQIGLCIGPVVSILAVQPPVGERKTPPIALPAAATPNDGKQPAADAEAPLTKLLPPAPDAAPLRQPWLVGDLARVPEVCFQKAEAGGKKPQAEPRTVAERQQALDRELQEQQKTIAKLTKLMAGINRLNAKGTDHFMTLLRDQRPDLAGLPFVLGNACRLGTERGKAFVTGVAMARGSMPREPEANEPPRDAANQATRFWVGYTARHVWGHARSHEKQGERDWTDARIAALMQVLGPEDKAFQKGLIKHLSETPGSAATRALGRLAVFSFEEEVRQAALAALKQRPQQDATEVLLAGLRFPWPAVAENAGAAAIQLGRKDLVPQLVSLLDEPDPRAPAETAVNGKKTLAVREVVRLNHRRSCLLCHPPANLPEREFAADGKSPNVVTGPVPTIEQPQRSPFFGYDPSGSPPESLRACRRDLFATGLLALAAGGGQRCEAADAAFRLPRPHPPGAAHLKGGVRAVAATAGPRLPRAAPRAAVAALRALTGRDAAEPTAQAWRAVLAK